MADQHDHSTPPVQRAEHEGFWASVRFTELFHCFSIARRCIGPALLLVIVVYLGGRLMDLAPWSRVLDSEFAQYQLLEGGSAFDTWRQQELQSLDSQLAGQVQRWTSMSRSEAAEQIQQANPWVEARRLLNAYFDQRRSHFIQLNAQSPQRLPDDDLAATLKQIESLRAEALGQVDTLEPGGVFETVLRVKIEAFGQIMRAAVTPGTWINQPGQIYQPVLRLTVDLPCWLWRAHKTFLIIWGLITLAIWALLGGAISRMAMMQAARNQRISLGEATRYAGRHWLNYLLAPVAVPLMVAVIALILALAGGVLVQWASYVPVINWIADLIAGLGFGLAIGLGLLMAVLLILWAPGVHLMYPALAAEGSDALDAVARACGYVFGRPWRLLFYSLVALVYGAATYLFVGLVIFAALTLTQAASSALAERLDILMPPPQWSQLEIDQPLSAEQVGWSGVVAGTLMRVWTYLAIAVVAAYAISFYFAASSVIYLLLRRVHDGTDMGQCYTEPADHPEPTEQDKVEPPAESPDKPAGDSSD
jgi:hypothetical protein